MSITIYSHTKLYKTNCCNTHLNMQEGESHILCKQIRHYVIADFVGKYITFYALNLLRLEF